jgi:hypothetical protein
MCPRVLGDIKTVDIISRFSNLAVTLNCLLDSSVMPVASTVDTIINRGEVLAKYVPSDSSAHVGKYRPYAESNVTAAFATNSINFTLDASIRSAAWFIPGDVIEGVDGTALGTIATYNPATGVGTLAANASNAYGSGGQAVRLAAANWTLGSKLGLILVDECIVEAGVDQPVAGYREGFFVQSLTSLTAAAITALGAAVETPGEVRIQ